MQSQSDGNVQQSSHASFDSQDNSDEPASSSAATARGPPDGWLIGLAELMAYLFAIIGALENLRDIRQTLAAIPNQSMQISFAHDQLEVLKHALSFAEQNFQDYELDSATDRIKRIRTQIQIDATIGAVVTELRVLNEVAGDQLDRRHSVYIPLKKLDFYLKVLEIFPKDLIFVFPGVDNDITEACWCYALDRNTACVFHCMGILQRGLHSLAKDLNVPFADTLDLENWKNIIDQIEKKIRELESLKKGPEKDEKLSFYSNAAVQFRYFKDAWRNHVAHLREQYDADQAHSILIHVRDFIRDLGEPKLKELEEAIARAVSDKKNDKVS